MIAERISETWFVILINSSVKPHVIKIPFHHQFRFLDFDVQIFLFPACGPACFINLFPMPLQYLNFFGERWPRFGSDRASELHYPSLYLHRYIKMLVSDIDFGCETPASVLHA